MPARHFVSFFKQGSSTVGRCTLDQHERAIQVQSILADRVGGRGAINIVPVLLAIHVVAASVVMTMMHIRIVRMTVSHRFVHVRMRVRLFTVPKEIMGVLVMRVVPMLMVMRQFVVLMQVIVVFTYVQPHADGHQSACQPKRHIRMFGEEQQR